MRAIKWWMSDDPDIERRLEERDERVRRKILELIEDREESARQYEQDARDLRTSANRMRYAVKSQLWFEFEMILSEEDIESLCDVSPSDLLNEGGDR